MALRVRKDEYIIKKKVKATFIISSIIIIVLLVGCQVEKGSSLVLLDKTIKAVHISKSNGIGEMNTEIQQSFSDENSIGFIEKSLDTAQKQLEKIDVSKPEFDMMVEYESSNDEVLTQGIHLWLGAENEKSTILNIEHDEFYLTTPKMTKKLRTLLIKE